MALSNIVLMWVPEGVVPTSGLPFDQVPASRLGYDVSPNHPSLRSAVDEAKQDRAQRKQDNFLPYIKVHTGEGVAIFNVQGILALDEALA